MHKSFKISALNLVPVKQDQDVKGAIDDLITIATHLDQSSYERLWIAEHHNTESIASSATRQLIHHTLQHTKNIRVGSGGVMLPNHSPLIVAEEFGTLHAIFGDRIDIGLGRAPGTDMKTARAIRRNVHDGVFNFGDEVSQLKDYLNDHHNGVVAYPGKHSNLPLFILGSSTDSAHLAASLGLPYAFASHFAPQEMSAAFKIYEENFTPSEQLQEPYKISCLNVIMADDNQTANYLSTTLSQFVLNVVRHGKEKLKPPVSSMDGIWSDSERYIVESRFPVALLGDKETVLEQIRVFQSQYSVDEIMAVSYIYDMDAMKHSLNLFEEVASEYNS